MPRKDGTGPVGQGRKGLQGRKSGSGLGGGRMGGPMSAGPEGYCVCPKCGAKVTHQRGQPCNSIKCQQCGSVMTREA